MLIYICDILPCSISIAIAITITINALLAKASHSHNRNRNANLNLIDDDQITSCRPLDLDLDYTLYAFIFYESNSAIDVHQNFVGFFFGAYSTSRQAAQDFLERRAQRMSEAKRRH